MHSQSKTNPWHFSRVSLAFSMHRWRDRGVWNLLHMSQRGSNQSRFHTLGGEDTSSWTRFLSCRNFCWDTTPSTSIPWTHRAYLLHSPCWSCPQQSGKCSLCWLCTDSRHCLTGWLPTFSEVFSEDVTSAMGSAFCERCKLSISLPNPVSFSLLAFLCQWALICDLWFCWCPIRQLRFRFFPSSRYFMADAQVISSMQTLTELTFVPGQSPSFPILHLLMHCKRRGCPVLQMCTEHPG